MTLLFALSWLAALFAHYASAQNSTSAQDATYFAVVYGYPLLSFQKLAGIFINGNHTNTSVHLRGLATPGETAVVKPNVDTLYSTAIFDISQSDVILTIPNIPADQFALFSLYDPYGDNFVNLGTGLSNGAGSYELRQPPDGTFETGVQSTAGSNNTVLVYSPSAYGTLLIRWLVNATNLDALHGYQDRTTLQTVPSTHNSSTPALVALNTTTSDTAPPPQRVLDLLAQYAPWCGSQTAASSALVSRELGAAGILDGAYSAPPGIDLEGANQTALATISASATNASNNVVLNNGWTIPQPSIQGTFQNATDYAIRASVAFFGYLELQAPLAVYPTWQNTSAANTNGSSDGTYYVGPNDAYIYTFSRKPPLQRTGFWSLTAYENNFLIPNSLNRSEIGDRSNLTYSNGLRVYGGSSADGPFQVLIQAADNPPPSNWTSNWIPAPAGGGTISALLRFYSAMPEILNGTYVYPVVERRDAIVAGTNTSSSPSTTGTATRTSSAGGAPTSTTSSGERVSPMNTKVVILSSLAVLFGSEIFGALSRAYITGMV